jgi:hypothetical protein
MKLNCDREDIQNMVYGISPAYIAFNHELVNKCGTYCGGFHDKWSWNKSEIEMLSLDELVKLYLICKMSWKIDEHKLRNQN